MNVLAKGQRVDLLRTVRGRRMVAKVNDAYLGEVVSIIPGQRGGPIGWVTVRIPFQNCVLDPTDPRGGMSEVEPTDRR